MSLPRMLKSSQKGKYPYEVIDKRTGEKLDPRGMELVLFPDGTVGQAYPMDCSSFEDQYNYEVRFLESDYDDETEKRKAEKQKEIDELIKNSSPWMADLLRYLPDDED